MNTHESHVLVETLAWTLIHFLWQGALVALVLWLLLATMGSRTSRARYLTRCGALALMAFAPLVTFLWLWGDAPELPLVTASSGAPLEQVPAAAAESFWSEPLTWVVAAWCLGALLCVLRFSGGLLQVVRLRRSTVGIDLAPRWQRRFDALARDFGVRARARVVESASVCVPAVIGCVKPIVLLPARIFSGLSDAQIEALLAHELAHVARHDYLVNIVQSIVESLLFYHPAVWWVSRGIRVEREYCCDDLAVDATQNGLAYAHALTALESWRGAQPQLGVSTLGGSLMSRIQRLVGLQPERPRRAVRPAHAIAGLFVAGTLGASAFAFASMPEPAACDCKCACHAKAGAKKAQVLLRAADGTPLPEGHRRLPQAIGRWHAAGAVVDGEAPEVRWVIKNVDDEGHEEVIERYVQGKAEYDRLEANKIKLEVPEGVNFWSTDEVDFTAEGQVLLERARIHEAEAHAPESDLWVEASEDGEYARLLVRAIEDEEHAKRVHDVLIQRLHGDADAIEEHKRLLEHLHSVEAKDLKERHNVLLERMHAEHGSEHPRGAHDREQSWIGTIQGRDVEAPRAYVRYLQLGDDEGHAEVERRIRVRQGAPQAKTDHFGRFQLRSGEAPHAGHDDHGSHGDHGGHDGDGPHGEHGEYTLDVRPHLDSDAEEVELDVLLYDADGQVHRIEGAQENGHHVIHSRGRSHQRAADVDPRQDENVQEWLTTVEGDFEGEVHNTFTFEDPAEGSTLLRVRLAPPQVDPSTDCVEEEYVEVESVPYLSQLPVLNSLFVQKKAEADAQAVDVNRRAAEARVVEVAEAQRRRAELELELDQLRQRVQMLEQALADKQAQRAEIIKLKELRSKQ